jgi:hypothetical protein
MQSRRRVQPSPNSRFEAASMDLKGCVLEQWVPQASALRPVYMLGQTAASRIPKQIGNASSRRMMRVNGMSCDRLPLSFVLLSRNKRRIAIIPALIP